MISKLIKRLCICLFFVSLVYCKTTTETVRKTVDTSKSLIPTNICDNEWLWFQTDNCIEGLQHISLSPQIVLLDSAKQNQEHLKEIEKSFMIHMNAYIAVLLSAKREVH